MGPNLRLPDSDRGEPAMSTHWQTFLEELWTAQGSLSADDLGMEAASEDDLRDWVDDLEARIGINVASLRDALETYLQDRRLP
jgi:hypothetical protein